MEMLCQSSLTSRENPWSDIGFQPFSYSTEPFLERDYEDENGNKDEAQHKYYIKCGKKYDTDSIMYYSSDYYGKEGFSDKIPRNVYNVPLVKWKNGGEVYTAREKITEENAELTTRDFSKGPGDGNLEGVRELYPWEG
jgi:hypothetical protein